MRLLKISAKINQEIESLNFNIDKNKSEVKKTLQEKSKVWLIVFFVFMFFMTLLSRSADSLTVSKVSIINPFQGNLKFDFFGDGVIESKSEKTVNAMSDIQVEDIYVEEGQRVNVGDKLFALSKKDIDDKLFLAQNDVKKVQIQITQEKTVADKSEITSQEKAQIKLDNYNTDFEIIKSQEEYNVEIASQALEKAKIKFDEENENYNKELKKTKEDKIKEKSDLYETAKEEYDTVKLSFDEELLKAQREVEDAKKALDRIEGKDNGDRVTQAIREYNSIAENGTYEEVQAAAAKLDKVLYGEGGAEDHKDNVADAKLKLKRFNEDFKSVQYKWEYDLNLKKEKMEKVQDELNDMQNDTYDFSYDIKSSKQSVDSAETEKENMENKLEQTIHDRETALQKAQRDIDIAQKDLEQSIKEDENVISATENEKTQSALKIKNLQIDLQEKQRQVSRINDIKKNDGIISSSLDGVVEKINIEQGQKTNLNAALILSMGIEGYIFRAKIEKDSADYIEKGDIITINFKGKNEKIKLNIYGIKYLEDEDSAEITAEMPSGEFISGMTALFEVNKITDSYKKCVPVSAIRTDIKSDYVLIIEERDSVLGKEMIAVRKDITVIDKDSKTAAIEGFVENNQEVISESSKNISEGDRVRVKE